MSTFDMSDVSSVSDVVNKVQQFDLDFIGIARENVGVFMSVSYIIQLFRF